MAQTVNDSVQVSKNTIFIEFMGNGGLYSINYDRILYDKEKFKFSARIGLSSLRCKTQDNIYGELFTTYIIIPFQLNIMKKLKSQWHIEGGSGITYIDIINTKFIGDPAHPGNKEYFENKYKKDYGIYFPVNLGVRFQEPGDHFFFKASLIPLIVIIGIDYFGIWEPIFPWAGFGFGYTF